MQGRISLKRLTLALAAAALAALMLAGSAQAHVLTFKEARNAAFDLVRQECQRYQGCDGYQAGPEQRRINAHKVKVKTHFWGSNAQVGDYDCHRIYTILIREGSNQRYYTRGPRNCVPNTDHF
jgi:hypothetical protein